MNRNIDFCLIKNLSLWLKLLHLWLLILDIIHLLQFFNLIHFFLHAFIIF